MVDRTANDNDLSNAAERSAEPDAHGHAALLLIEGLIHTLVSRSFISVEEAVEIVDTAAEVELEIADDLGVLQEPAKKSLVLLEAISASLRNDLRER